MSRANKQLHRLVLDTRRSENPTSPSKTTWRINDHHLCSLRGAHIRLEHCVIPNSVYPIRSGNQKIWVYDTPDIHTITITEGFYSIETLADELQTQLDAVGNQTFTVSYSLTNYKLTIGGSSTFRLGWFGEDNAYELLGFDISSNSDTTFTSSTTSDFPVSLSGTHHVKVVSNLPTNHQYPGVNLNVLTVIPMHVPAGEIVYYNPPISEPIHLSNSGLTTLELSLYDDWNNLWELPENQHAIFTFIIDSVEHDQAHLHQPQITPFHPVDEKGAERFFALQSPF